MSTRVARRYAKALFALAQEGRALDAVAAELAALRGAFDDPALSELLASPSMTAARLQALVKALAERMQLSDLTTRFLGVLAENRRLDQLAAAADHFETLHDRALNRTRITIRSASPLSAQRERELIQRFERITGKTVLATVTIDPALLGGVVVEADGKVFDGSVRTQLDELAHEITSTRTHL
jgi:F-type H+-transporting ATPase subunit delta